MLGPAADLVDVQLRTVREARAAARLDHPGVVKVFDVVWRDDRAWIVMEYVRSRSLYAAVRADGPMGHREAARVGVRLLAALRAAHAAGVLHLDVKPPNVLLAADGRVVLGDFGLAVTRDRDGGPEPVLMGSPFYVAPERISPQGRPSPATDLWSLGATLYAATEGRAPFARDTTEASLLAVLHEEPTPATHPGPLTPVLLDLLAKNRDERPHPADLERRLREIAEGRIPGKTPAKPARGLARVPATTLPQATYPQPAPPQATPPQAAPPRATPDIVPPDIVPPDIVPPDIVPPALAAAARRPRRRHLIAGAAVAVILAGAAGGAIVLDHQRAAPTAVPNPVLAPSTRAAAAPIAPSPCGTGAEAAAVVPARTRIPAGLPAGWVWFRDPAGFTLALPSGWRRSTSGTAVCFQDPKGDGAFTVDSAALVTRTPLTYFQSQEKAGKPAGYRRISMDVLLMRRGGADWEYTWHPDSDTTQHVRRVLLAVTDNRSYLLKWATPDTGWSRYLQLERRLVALFDSAT
jgi:hypothetical protein